MDFNIENFTPTDTFDTSSDLTQTPADLTLPQSINAFNNFTQGLDLIQSPFEENAQQMDWNTQNDNMLFSNEWSYESPTMNYDDPFTQPHFEESSFDSFNAENTIMPRSLENATNASSWADYYENNAKNAEEWAKWDLEHNPDNTTHHLNEMAEEQAKADAKRAEVEAELNKKS
jgi:hypothetical protein